VVLARRGHLVPDALLIRRGARMLAAAGAMGLALELARRALFATPLHGATKLLALAVLVGVGLATYAAAVQLFGAYDLRTVTQRLVRRQTRAAAVEKVR
jgi:putative peptidoglycan lipid II flippase